MKNPQDTFYPACYPARVSCMRNGGNAYKNTHNAEKIKSGKPRQGQKTQQKK